MCGDGFLSHPVVIMVSMLMTTDPPSIDAKEQRLFELEAIVSRVRAEQLDVIAELDQAQIATVDGARNLAEWVTGRLDVAPETGRALAYAAVSESKALQAELEAGEVTLDRVVETRRLANAGADADTLERARGVAVNQVRRLVTQRVEMSGVEEAVVFQTRALYAQPNLQNTMWNLRGRLPACDGEIVFTALEDTADRLSSAKDPHRPTLAATPQRRPGCVGHGSLGPGWCRESRPCRIETTRRVHPPRRPVGAENLREGRDRHPSRRQDRPQHVE